MSSKFGVPKPVTASHPLTVGKPVVLQPLFEPLVISVKPLPLVWYNQGLRKPRGDLPELISASLTSARIPAMSGAEAEVPEMIPTVPFQTYLK